VRVTETKNGAMQSVKSSKDESGGETIGMKHLSTSVGFKGSESLGLWSVAPRGPQELRGEGGTSVSADDGQRGPEGAQRALDGPPASHSHPRPSPCLRINHGL